MRVQINLDERLVSEIDRRVDRRQSRRVIAATLRRALEDDRRWDDILAPVGTLADAGHAWNEDPAAWVRAPRHRDQRGVR